MDMPSHAPFSAANRCARDRDLIVLVADLPGPRVAKIALALKRAGKRIVLLSQTAPTFHSSHVIDEIHQVRDPAAAVAMAARYRPLVYHVFASWSFDIARALIEAKPGPIVFDDYDVLSGIMTVRQDAFYTPLIPREEYCLRNADGICCRCLETQIPWKGWRRNGISLPPRKLFLDGCWADLLDSPRFVPAGPLPAEPHVVYVGNLVTADDSADDPFNFHFWLAERFARDRIHYHIYPPESFSENFSLRYRFYLDHMKKNPYFHFHHPVACDALSAELSQYDFGILILSRDVRGLPNDDYTSAKYDVCIGNKVFDYFDAELPILVHPGRFTRAVATRYGGAVTLRPDDLDRPRGFLESLDYPALRQGARASRNRYALSRHTDDLIAFYSRVCETACAVRGSSHPRL